MSADDRPVIVEAVGLTRIFRDFWGRPKALAVNGIDFEVKQGEILGLLGPNGSGKSTTVKMLLGLLKITQGRLRVFNQHPSHVLTKRRIGYLPEETYLYKHLTAMETLDFFGALFNLPASERRRRSRELLEMVGLGHSGDRPVGEFSKGMARGIGIAQALINDPDLVILDEPTSGLDPLGCREVKNLVKTMAERGKTVILCSHLLADVEDVCDTALIMYGGKVRARGALDNLLTVEDRTRIEAPKLEPEVAARVMSILNDAAGPDEATLTNPRRNLEEFFLDVVRQARAESDEVTSGAVEGGKLASHLATPETAAVEEEGPSQEVLQQLSEAATPEEPTAAPVDDAKPEPDKPEVTDVDKLANLAAPEEPAKPAEPTADSKDESEEAKEERAAADDRLRDLLGND